MKVSVYPRTDGKLDVLVEASLGNGKPPVLVKGVERGSVAGEIGPVIDAQRGRVAVEPAG